MKMKLVVFWVWFLVMHLVTSAAAPVDGGGGAKTSTWTRKLKEERYQEGTSSVERNWESGNTKLDDYHLLDPPPSSGVITSGPIEHGTPIIPYIPKPKPNSNATCPPSPSPVPSPTENV